MTKAKEAAEKKRFGSSANTATNSKSKQRAQSRPWPSAHWPV